MRHSHARSCCAVLAALTLVTLSPLLLPGSAAAQSNVIGEWRTLSYTTPINPIHVALMRTGKILIAVGTENDPTHTVNRAAVYDWRTGTFALQNIPWDLFCNAMSALPDGRIFITGGNERYNSFDGIKTTTIFDPVTEKFIQVQDMARGRWYPSNALLADGRIMTFAGITDTGSMNDTVEIYDVPTGWSPEFRAPFTPWWYPWLHLLPDGKVFLAGPKRDTHRFDPVTKAWTFVANSIYAASSAMRGREYGSSVLLPLRPEEGYRARVVIMGGDTGAQATDKVELIDLSAPSPAWRNLPPMSTPRVHMNAVLLPNGKILTLGGSARFNIRDANGAALNAQILDPVSETWSPAGRMAFWRLYHSVALLLPDATVWVAGSNPYQGSWEDKMEIYSPPYLFNPNGTRAARPTITAAPAAVGYNATFSITTPNASDIGSVVLVRPGSATHGFDFDRRLVGLSFTAGSGTLILTSPPNSKIAPPGYYMLFILNRNGVPSVAKFVQLTTDPTNTAPEGTITNPTADVTILAGDTVTFAGDGVDPDGAVTRYSWVFPSGTPATSTVPTPGAVRFSTPGRYIVSLTVTDDQGANDPSPPSRTITVQPRGFTASITSPPEGQTVSGDQTIAMAVSGAGAPNFTYVLKIDGAQVFTTTTPATTATYTWNTGTASEGPHTLTLTVTDANNQVATATRTLTVRRSGAMTVALTTPKPGEQVSGTSWVNVWVSGGSGPFNYTLSVAGTTVWTESSSNAHVALPWDTTRTPNGPQTLTATVHSASKTASASVNVIVQNGGGGPGPLTAAITSPTEGANLSGTVTVSMTASGGTPNYSFTLRIDGTIVLSQNGPGTSASYTWNTSGNGTRTLSLTVTDGNGATATVTRTVTVNNDPNGTLGVALTSPKTGSTVSGTVWANVWIQAPFGTPPYTYTLTAAGATVWTQSSSNTHVALPWETPRTPNGAQTLTATVRDASGATGSASVNVIVQNAGGGPGPLTATITSPSEGATVGGTVTVALGASGGTPAYTYTLSIDGTQVFTQTTPSGTASHSWNTTTSANGSHTLGLTVTDSAGGSATVTRTVTVANDAGGTLRIALTSPAAGQTVSGTVWANIWIEAPHGTAPYTFTLTAAGATVWQEASSATHVALPWVTTQTPNGPQTLTATVRDAAGAIGSATVGVTVQNP